MLRLFPAIIAAATALACSAVEVDQIDVPSAGGDYFFWVAINEKGAPARLSPVFGLDGARIRFGGDPLFKLEPNEEGAVAITFTNADLLTTHPGFMANRGEEITVALELPPPETIRYDVHARARLPSGSIMVTEDGGGDSAPILDNVTLSIPIDSEYCRGPSGTRMSRFGSRGQLLSPDVMVPGEENTGGPTDEVRRFIRVFKLDRDRVLAIAQRLMFIVRRGESIESGTIFRTDRVLPMTSIHTYAAALTEPSTNGTRTLFAAGEVGGWPGVLELEVQGDQIRFVRTATVVTRPGLEGQELQDITLDLRGNVIAVGEGGVVLVREQGRTNFELRTPIPGAGAFIYRAILDSNDARRPHLLSETNGRILSGDAVTDQWDLFERNDRFDNLRFYAFASSREGDDHWAVGVNGSVFRQVPGRPTDPPRWDVVDLWVPPSFSRCTAVTAQGERTFVSTIRSIAIDDHAVYLGIDECTALLRVQRSDLCVSVLTAEDSPVDASDLDWWAMEIKQGELIAGGRNGQLYSIGSP